MFLFSASSVFTGCPQSVAFDARSGCQVPAFMMMMMMTMMMMMMMMIIVIMMMMMMMMMMSNCK